MVIAPPIVEHPLYWSMTVYTKSFTPLEAFLFASAFAVLTLAAVIGFCTSAAYLIPFLAHIDANTHKILNPEPPIIINPSSTNISQDSINTLNRYRNQAIWQSMVFLFSLITWSFYWIKKKKGETQSVTTLPSNKTEQ